ncbi:hypothetical protein EJA70_31125 [Pseudomonas sp. PB103]|nr:hypothetical protein EJA70_31125 [Pseudomonas sp. PB103]
MAIRSPHIIQCRSCRRLRSFDPDLEKDQKIAAFGSSYSGFIDGNESIPGLGISLEKSELSFCP